MMKRKDLNVLGATGTPLNIKHMAELQSEENGTNELLIPRLSTSKVDWEIMVDGFSDPQPAPFDMTIEDGPPHSNEDWI